MYPTINIFGRETGTYALMAVLGFVIAGFFCILEGKRKKIDVNDFIILFLVIALGILLGGHILYAITNFDEIIYLFQNLEKVTSFKMLFNILRIIFGGSVFYGGLIGAFIAILIYQRCKKVKLTKEIDIIAVAIPLFHFFGRIGCFLTGCCYGIESTFGFVYHNSLMEAANHVKRLPIQLIEASFNLGLFIFLFYGLRKNKFENKIIYIYLIIYPIGRFIFEFFRGDEIRGFFLGLSTSQIISIFLFVFSLLKLILKKRKI